MCGFSILQASPQYLNSLEHSSLHIITERTSPRLEYVCKVIFACVLGVPYRIVTQPPPEGIPALQYLARPNPGLPWMECSPLLFRSGTESFRRGWEADFADMQARSQSGYFDAPLAEMEVRRGDVFADVFSLLCDASYNEWESPYTPGHDILDGNDGIWEIPIVSEWSLELWTNLRKKQPQLPAPGRNFSYHITLDVDHPWKHRHKSLPVIAGGLLKSVLTLSQTGERFRAVLRGRDPYDIWDKVQTLIPPNKGSIFFLVDSNSPYDSRFTSEIPAYAELIRSVAAMGYATGLHPSFTSCEDEDRIRKEKKMLESALGKTVDISRQHYLRYKLPETFRFLESAGIRHEYSLCPREGTGFPRGMCVSYPWYDVQQERISEMWLHPACVMDRGLLKTAHTPKQSVAEIRAVLKEVRKVNGDFVIILHNETFSESGEWSGWTKVIEEMMRELNKA